MEWFIQISLLSLLPYSYPRLSLVELFLDEPLLLLSMYAFKLQLSRSSDHPSSALRSSPVQPICLWVQGAVNCKQFSRFPVHDLNFFFLSSQ